MLHNIRRIILLPLGEMVVGELLFHVNEEPLSGLNDGQVVHHGVSRAHSSS